MTYYKKYINALKKCAKEHENDRTSTGHIIVSDLCRDTVNLLEELEQEPTTKNLCDTCGNIINCMMQSGIVRTECSMYSSPKNDLGVDYISRQEVLRLLANSIGKSNTYLQTQVLRMPSVTPNKT